MAPNPDTPLSSLAETSPFFVERGVQLRRLTREDEHAVMGLIERAFLPHEPVRRMLSLPAGDLLVGERRRARLLLDSGLSLGCFDAATGRLASIMLSRVCERATEASVKRDAYQFPPSCRAFVRFVETVYARDLFRLLDADRFFTITLSATAAGHRAMGLVERMTEVSVRLARDSGCRHAVVLLNSSHFLNYMRKLGARVVAEVDYGAYRDPDTGRNPFAGKVDPAHPRATLITLDLAAQRK